MHRFIITARQREDAAEKVAQVLRGGPLFNIAETSLERHEVLMFESEVVFLFEGAHAEEEARRLMFSRSAISRLGRLGVHIDRGPCLPREVFSWERPPQLDGVTFGPQPGPGNSDGGPAP